MKSLPCVRLLLLLLLLLLAAAAWATAAAHRVLGRDVPPVDDGDLPEPKYFKEAYRLSHYDARFMVAPLDEEPHQGVLRTLVQTYLATCERLGIQTWLMHGSLLGWWWGRRRAAPCALLQPPAYTPQVMPWDFDVDVQVTEADMYYLAAYHNMTVHYYKNGGMNKGRYFLLDINPHFRHRETDDVLNFIDARWIDMATGLFIDITAARYDLRHRAGEGMLYDKYGHEYRDTYVFPLRNTTFEGVPAKIPFRYQDMLESEYGRPALTKTRFRDHVFDEDKMQWVRETKRHH